jgi:hypothetical protein
MKWNDNKQPKSFRLAYFERFFTKIILSMQNMRMYWSYLNIELNDIQKQQCKKLSTFILE